MRLFKGKTATPHHEVLVDSGADYSTFHPELAGALGIDIYSGEKSKTYGVGEGEIWLHRNVGIAIEDPSGNQVALWLKQVGFLPNLKIAGLLGRLSFFDAFDVVFEHRDQQVRLRLHGDVPNLVKWENVPSTKPPLPPAMQSRKKAAPRAKRKKKRR